MFGLTGRPLDFIGSIAQRPGTIAVLFYFAFLKLLILCICLDWFDALFVCFLWANLAKRSRQWKDWYEIHLQFENTEHAVALFVVCVSIFWPLLRMGRSTGSTQCFSSRKYSTQPGRHSYISSYHLHRLHHQACIPGVRISISYVGTLLTVKLICRAEKSMLTFSFSVSFELMVHFTLFLLANQISCARMKKIRGLALLSQHIV